MKDTKNGLKKITRPIKPRDVCILALTHQRNYSCKIVEYINGPIIDSVPGCFPCETKLKKNHTKSVESDSSNITYEEFRDTQVYHSLLTMKSTLDCEHSNDKTVHDFKQKVEDFEAFIVQKYLTT
jgi:hypothetical protein